MANDISESADAQDLAEVFDETNTTRDGEDIAHPDMAGEVLDVTSEEEDSEPFDTDGEDFDPDLADEAELELALDMDDGIDEARSLAPDDADRVSTDDASPADYEAGDPSEGEEGHDPEVDRQLDIGLEETFPASDPVSIDPEAD